MKQDASGLLIPGSRVKITGGSQGHPVHSTLKKKKIPGGSFIFGLNKLKIKDKMRIFKVTMWLVLHTIDSSVT